MDPLSMKWLKNIGMDLPELRMKNSRIKTRSIMSLILARVDGSL